MAEEERAQAADAEIELHLKKPRTKKSDKKLEKLKEKYEKRGIVYLSRLPPHLVRPRREILERIVVRPLTAPIPSYRNPRSFATCWSSTPPSAGSI